MAKEKQPKTVRPTTVRPTMAEINELIKNPHHKARVHIRMEEKICGGIPKCKNLIDRWQGSVGGTPEHAKRIIEEMGGDELEDIVEGCQSGFKKGKGRKNGDNNNPNPGLSGLYIEARQVKAMLKEAACITGITVTYKNPSSKELLAHGLYVRPARLYLGVEEPTGTEETVVQVKTAQGPLSAIKRFDYVEGVEFQFRIDFTKRVDEVMPLTPELLHLCLVHAQSMGLGSNRSQGYGMFELVSFEMLPDDSTWMPDLS